MTNKCPECRNKLVYQQGCSHCQACGYSSCEPQSDEDILDMLFIPDFGSNVKFTKE